ncbi:cytochrome D ubiquinol oxidase subunit II [Candidatus Nitromaritima sp. SCGC AAA799-C22]|nr:cytochrome D ubiquinol oxidase subunit II [Candidatus Nitromaritima sp. SCGC AAA799-C22]
MPNKNFKTGNPEIDKAIQDMVDLFTPPDAHANQCREILTTVAKFFLEHRDLGDYKLINTTLKELRHAFRIFLPYRDIRKVVVFGSARTEKSDPCYALARELAEQVTHEGMMVITGAGDGIMGAANQGAGKEKSFGINIKLPFEQRANPYISDDPKLMLFKYFFTRKLIFIKESDATVLLPGGVGTMDEGFENLTLLQTGKSLPRPIIFLEPENGTYWKTWLEWIESVLLKNEFMSPDDIHLFQLKHSAKEACRAIVDFYRVYHSLRYVRGLTVLRFTRPVPQKVIDRLNDEFADLLADGKIESAAPLKDKLKNHAFTGEMPCLVLNFDKHRYGRLHQMIWKINEWVD